MPNYTHINLFFPVTFELIYRPKAMTVAVIIAGLLPIMQGHGTGSEVMQRIAAPMVGGNDYGTVVVLVCRASGLFGLEE